MEKHLMIDLETLSTEQDAAILSIGAVSFDITGCGNAYSAHVETGLDHGFLMSSMYCPRHAPKQRGRSISESTLKWWSQQTSGAIGHIREGMEKAIPLEEMLFQFSYFAAGHDAIWSNGATFDAPIMEHAFKTYGIDIPWKFNQSRCFRTLKALVPLEIPFVGIKHDALYDALHQANYTIKALNNILKGLQSGE